MRQKTFQFNSRKNNNLHFLLEVKNFKIENDFSFKLLSGRVEVYYGWLTKLILLKYN